MLGYQCRDHVDIGNLGAQEVRSPGQTGFTSYTLGFIHCGFTRWEIKRLHSLKIFRGCETTIRHEQRNYSRAALLIIENICSLVDTLIEVRLTAYIN